MSYFYIVQTRMYAHIIRSNLQRRTIKSAQENRLHFHKSKLH